MSVTCHFSARTYFLEDEIIPGRALRLPSRRARRAASLFLWLGEKSSHPRKSFADCPRRYFYVVSRVYRFADLTSTATTRTLTIYTRRLSALPFTTPAPTTNCRRRATATRARAAATTSTSPTPSPRSTSGRRSSPSRHPRSR